MELKKILQIPAKEKWVFGQVIDVPDKSFAILIQGGNVSLVKYHYPTEEEPYMTLSHPLNAKSIDKELTAIIKSTNPKALFIENDILYYCPKEWSDKAIWTNA